MAIADPPFSSRTTTAHLPSCFQLASVKNLHRSNQLLSVCDNFRPADKNLSTGSNALTYQHQPLVSFTNRHQPTVTPYFLAYNKPFMSISVRSSNLSQGHSAPPADFPTTCNFSQPKICAVQPSTDCKLGILANAVKSGRGRPFHHDSVHRVKSDRMNCSVEAKCSRT